jgi:hypothetical protein
MRSALHLFALPRISKLSPSIVFRLYTNLRLSKVS